MKILITGASGFVGRNVAEYLAEHVGYHEIFTPTSKELNCIDEEAVKSYLKQKYFDIILNFAVYGNSIDTSKDGSKILDYNLRIFYNFAHNRNLYGKMFYTGSGAEFDKRFPICQVKEKEIGKTIPIDQYGFMKYIIGNEIERMDNIYNIRIFGLFGKYEYWKTKFISNICCKAVKNLPLTIRQNVYFDYLWIDDFCKILCRLIEMPLQYKTYNITSGTRIDLFSLCNMVNSISQKSIPIFIAKEGFANEYTASNERLRMEIPDTNITDLKVSMENLYHWYQMHEDEIDNYSLLYM